MYFKKCFFLKNLLWKMKLFLTFKYIKNERTKTSDDTMLQK